MTTTISGTTGVTFPVTAGGTSAVQASSSKVLQVVSATSTTQVNNTSQTFADSGLTATITPSSSANKILVLVNHGGSITFPSGSVNSGVKHRVMRDATQIAYNDLCPFSTAASVFSADCVMSTLDSPSTTSPVVYKSQFAQRESNGSTASICYNTSLSTITLMEIAA